MRRVIVNADDLGLSEGVSLGIIRAHQTGVVTSATVMMNMPGAVAALELVRPIPTLGIGIHLTLTGGCPVSGDVPSLTGPDGRFLKLPVLTEAARRDHLERELRAQVDAFLKLGLKPTHLDSHHHVHMLVPAVTAIVTDLGRELNVPVRGTAGAPRFTDRFYGQGNIGVAGLIAIFDGIADGETVEIMSHPALLDPELLAASSYAVQRVQELATLTAPEVWEAAEAREITLIGYRDLQQKGDAPWVSG
ncbi:MAG TPA: carbohydrate deacetylase [Symbiobacteriaceae bacterium]|nr:carbohydrate deacetylase [Symbiobacteriaceae bacterium]